MRTSFRRVVYALGALVASLVCVAGTARRAAARAPAFAPDPCGAAPLSTAADSLDRMLARIMAARRVPGMAIAVVDHGRITTRAYGWADLEHCVPATDTTLFGIGSISKHFAAVGALLLVQAGKLSLDDPITRYLPEGKGVWDSITVRHLLTHTSGIPDYCGDDDKYPSITLDRASSPDTPALVRQIAAARLNFRPGDDWAYSNTGYLLLSILVERVSGQPFPAYMREHVFLPAGMTRTRFYSPVELIPGRATPYHVDTAGVVSHGPFISDQFSHWGDMGMLSTARDMARWSLAVDSLKLLSPELWQQMWTPARLNQGWTFPYGFALDVEEVRGEPLIMHTGTFRVGYSSEYQRWPRRELSVAVLSNYWGDHFPPDELVDSAAAGFAHWRVAIPRRPRPDPQPRLTAALLQLLHGADAANGALGATPAFRRLELPSLRRRRVAALRFLECTTPSRTPPRAFGTEVARACTYQFDQADSGSGERTLTFYFTRGDEVAGVLGW